MIVADRHAALKPVALGDESGIQGCAQTIAPDGQPGHNPSSGSELGRKDEGQRECAGQGGDQGHDGKGQNPGTGGDRDFYFQSAGRKQD
jgi:hypothetical protein